MSENSFGVKPFNMAKNRKMNNNIQAIILLPKSMKSAKAF